jgi:hypothetical protein
VVPVTVPAKVTGVVAEPLHTVWLAMAATVGVGFTVSVKIDTAPIQPEGDVGVTVNVAVAATVPALIAVNERLPVPLDGSPMVLLLFIQL